MRSALAAAALLAASPAFAANPELARAEELFDQLKYPEAAKALQRALAVPGNDRATVIRIYELMGINDATVGKKSALEHFRRLVAIDPEHTISRDYGPRILAPFYEAKARLDESPPLKLSTEARLVDGRQTLKVAVTSDSMRLAEAVRVGWRARGGEWNVKTG